MKLKEKHNIKKDGLSVIVTINFTEKTFHIKPNIKGGLNRDETYYKTKLKLIKKAIKFANSILKEE